MHYGHVRRAELSRRGTAASVLTRWSLSALRGQEVVQHHLGLRALDIPAHWPNPKTDSGRGISAAVLEQAFTDLEKPGLLTKATQTIFQAFQRGPLPMRPRGGRPSCGQLQLAEAELRALPLQRFFPRVCGVGRWLPLSRRRRLRGGRRKVRGLPQIPPEPENVVLAVAVRVGPPVGLLRRSRSRRRYCRRAGVELQEEHFRGLLESRVLPVPRRWRRGRRGRRGLRPAEAGTGGVGGNAVLGHRRGLPADGVRDGVAEQGPHAMQRYILARRVQAASHEAGLLAARVTLPNNALIHRALLRELVELRGPVRAAL